MAISQPMSPFNLDDEDEQPIEIEIQDIDPETGEETYMQIGRAHV